MWISIMVIFHALLAFYQALENPVSVWGPVYNLDGEIRFEFALVEQLRW
jgi:hypothetical protein